MAPPPSTFALFALLLLSCALAAADARRQPHREERMEDERCREIRGREEEEVESLLGPCQDFMRREIRSIEERRGESEEEPSQRCCRRIQRIPEEERCRAMEEAFGKRSQSRRRSCDEDEEEEEEEEKTRGGRYREEERSRRKRLVLRASSNLLQRCNLRPRTCSYRSFQDKTLPSRLLGLLY